jgi:hypothetical protein
MHLAAERGELRRNQIRSAGFLESEFRMRVQVAPPTGQFCVHLGDTISDRHGAVYSSSWFEQEGVSPSLAEKTVGAVVCVASPP